MNESGTISKSTTTAHPQSQGAGDSRNVAEITKDKDYSLGYIPALDGLRAISIILVLAFHEIGPVTSQYGHMFNGWVGVDVFFVISGFLITSILLKEAKEHNGEFSLRNFYARRWLRIAPVYYVYLAVVLGWHVWGGDHHLKPVICAALYLTNLDLAFGWNLIPLKYGLSHLWSLGLEEQFYLLWPACLKKLKQHAVSFVSSIIVLVYFWRLALVADGASWLRLVHGFDTKLDTIMYGVLTALLLSNKQVKETASRFVGNSIMQLTFFGSMFYAFHWLGHPMYGGMYDQLFFWGVKMPVTTWLITAFLVSVLCNPRALASVVLGTPVAVFIGRLSYSIYLWHTLVHGIYCGFYWDFFCKHGPTAELYQYMLILAVACISYYLIEKPFLKLKGRFS